MAEVFIAVPPVPEILDGLAWPPKAGEPVQVNDGSRSFVPAPPPISNDQSCAIFFRAAAAPGRAAAPPEPVRNDGTAVTFSRAMPAPGAPLAPPAPSPWTPWWSSEQRAATVTNEGARLLPGGPAIDLSSDVVVVPAGAPRPRIPGAEDVTLTPGPPSSGDGCPGGPLSVGGTEATFGSRGCPKSAGG